MDLSDMLSGQETEEARKVLKLLAEAAKDMDVTHLHMNELALGSNGIAASEALLTGNKNLKTLTFNDCGLESEAAKLISKYQAHKDNDIHLLRLCTCCVCMHMCLRALCGVVTGNS